MDEIKFLLGEYRDKEFGYSFQIIEIFINDRNLLDVVTEVERKNAQHIGLDFGGNYTGLQATPYVVEGDHFLGTSFPSWPKHHDWVLGCTCGNPGCWDILAFIEADDKIVRWSKIVNPWLAHGLPTVWHTEPPEDFVAFDYSSIGSYAFDRGQYDYALNNLRLSFRNMKP